MYSVSIWDFSLLVQNNWSRVLGPSLPPGINFFFLSNSSILVSLVSILLSFQSSLQFTGMGSLKIGIIRVGILMQ